MSEDPIQVADIRVEAGSPTSEELAAVTAVVAGALDALAGEQRRRGEHGQTQWQRSQRSLRIPLVRGAWRSYGS